MMRTELAGLRGGRKQQWLRLHRGEIISHCEANGPEATMTEFSIRRRCTLEKLMSDRVKPWESRTSADKALDMARLALEDNAMTRAALRRLQREFGQLVPLVVGQLAQGITKALQKIEIEMPALPEHTETSEISGVSDFVASRQIEAKRGKIYVMSRNKHI